MDIALRRAAPADAASIAAVFSASRRLLSFLPELHSVEEDFGYIRDIVLATQEVTLAEREGTMLGFIAESPGWIEHLYLEPAARGLGIGSRLLDDAKRRQDVLELWCFLDNLPARAFYERHGFVAAEFTDGSGNEANAPDVRYRWVRSGAA